MHMMVNANKECVVLPGPCAERCLGSDTPAGQLIKVLVQEADIVITDSKDEFGIDACSAKATNPSVVYTKIDLGLGEVAVQKKSGMCGRQYKNKNDAVLLKEDADRELMQSMLCEKNTAYYAASAVCAAMYAKRQGRGGQAVSVDLTAATMHNLMPDIFMCQSWISKDFPIFGKPQIMFPTKCADKHTDRDAEQEKALNALTGTCRMSEICEIFQCIKTSDDISVFVIAISDQEWNDMIDSFPELKETPPEIQVISLSTAREARSDGSGKITLSSAQVKEKLNGQWTTLPGRLADLAATLAFGEALVKSVTYEELVKKSKAGHHDKTDTIVYGKCLSPEEVLDNDQVKFCHTMVTQRHASGHAVRLPRPTAQFSVTQCSHQRQLPLGLADRRDVVTATKLKFT